MNPLYAELKAIHLEYFANGVSQPKFYVVVSIAKDLGMRTASELWDFHEAAVKGWKERKGG